MTLARVSVWSPSFSSELVMGSTLPWTSALTIRFSSLIAPERMRAKTASSVSYVSPSRCPARAAGTTNARCGFVRKGQEAIAGGGHARQSQYFDRERRRRVFDSAATIVEQRLDAALR